MNEHQPETDGLFYDRIAGFYDTMTGFADRFRREESILRALVTSYGIRTVLDVGAGTGLHSMLLARLGTEVTAVDVSSGMLDLLRDNAQRLGVRITAHMMSMESLAPAMTGSFDGVFCLGNTLTHLKSIDALRRTSTEFLRVLRPRGTVIVQILNFDRLNDMRDLPKFVRTESGMKYERSYERIATGVRLTVKTRREGEGQGQTVSVDLTPFTSRVLLTTLMRTGFRLAAVHGDLALSRFDPALSKDVVVVAQKS